MKHPEPNAGTCAICSGVWMLITRGPNKGKLVNHGFERPWGFAEQTKGCFGEKSEPYEVSTEVITRYTELLNRAHEHTTRGLANLKARPEELHDIDRFAASRGKEMVRIGKDHPRYELRLQQAIAEREGELRAIERDQKRMQQLLEKWPGVQPLKYKDPTKRGTAAHPLTYDQITVGKHYKLHRELVLVVRKVEDDGRRGIVIRLESGREYWTVATKLRPADPAFVARRKKVAASRKKMIARREAMQQPPTPGTK